MALPSKASKALREWCDQLGLSQVKAAAQVGIPLATFSDYYRGLRAPMLKWAFVLEDETGVPARLWLEG